MRRALLRWYDANARDWPWRRTRDAYRIWVAEVMLQQTRLPVVEPAYRRFLRAFPNLTRLARASEEEVLSSWSGLGYYSRARWLHGAARILIGDGARAFPRDRETALALPGVGEYTAAAVLSIAHGLPYAAVDGNVRRVLSRLACLRRPEQVRALAADLLDRERPGDWNQAVMELGQTVCLPRAPHCADCPVRVHCSAHTRARVHLHPASISRRPRERVPLHLQIVRDRSGRLLLERGAFPYLPHMWLPLVRVRPNGAGRKARRAFQHAILHRLFEVEVDLAVVSAHDLDRQAGRARTGTERAVFTARDLLRIGRSALLEKALRPPLAHRRRRVPSDEPPPRL